MSRKIINSKNKIDKSNLTKQSVHRFVNSIDQSKDAFDMFLKYYEKNHQSNYALDISFENYKIGTNKINLNLWWGD